MASSPLPVNQDAVYAYCYASLAALNECWAGAKAPDGAPAGQPTRDSALDRCGVQVEAFQACASKFITTAMALTSPSCTGFVNAFYRAVAVPTSVYAAGPLTVEYRSEGRTDEPLARVVACHHRAVRELATARGFDLALTALAGSPDAVSDTETAYVRDVLDAGRAGMVYRSSP